METLKKNFVEVLGKQMAFHMRGEGRPILFLHGNPTSSYLWRNVMPELDGLGRLIALDFIGMGDSEKLADPDVLTYSYAQHRQYLWAFIDKVVGNEPVILVVHDWGSALGFEWAMRHPDRVAGIVYMESIVRTFANWEEFPEQLQETFRTFRTKAAEEAVLDHNFFVEQLIPSCVIRKLTEEEMNEYRRPYPQRSDRWPTLAFPREIPVAGEPADVATVVDAYSEWLSASPIPKLFVNAEPGAALSGRSRDFCRTWPNQVEVTVPGIHFMQEDSGPEIGRAAANWVRQLGIQARNKL